MGHSEFGIVVTVRIEENPRSQRKMPEKQSKYTCIQMPQSEKLMKVGSVLFHGSGSEWDIREGKSTLWARRPKNSPHSLSHKKRNIHCSIKEIHLAILTNTFDYLDKYI